MARGRSASEPVRELDASRDRILDSAIQLFARHGVEGVSLSILADHVGLHKSTLFHHFRGKAELAEAALVRAVEPLCGIVEALRSEAPRDLEQLVEVGLRLDDHFAAHPASARFLLRTLVGPPDVLDESEELDRPDHPVSRIVTALGEWIAEARREGAIRRVRVRHAVIDLLGQWLLYPALADGSAGFPDPPQAPSSRRARREELAAQIRATFAPDGAR